MKGALANREEEKEAISLRRHLAKKVYGQEKEDFFSKKVNNAS